MAWFNRAESRSSVQVTQSDPTFFKLLGIDRPGAVSVDEALGVPAVWAAVNFLSGTIAGLPLHVYDKGGSEKKRVKATRANPVVSVLHDAVNDGLTSFQWRFDLMMGVLTEGRAVTHIERDAAGRVINLFPLTDFNVKRLPNGEKVYETGKDANRKTYAAADVIDLTFMLKPDLLGHRSPLRQCATAIGKAVRGNEYGEKIFSSGGLPAMVLQGPFESGKSAQRAAADVAAATKKLAQEGSSILAMPLGHELKALGHDPEKMQMVPAQEFSVIEIARIYSLPPTFLQDLSRATFSNSEQQDLHLVKHTIKRWCEQIEAELNLKLFGRGASRIAEFNLDGLLRGDYRTRMEGNSTAIQTGQLTPNEARALENREPLPGGEKLYIQGATVPMDGHTGEAPATPTQEDTPDEP